ncbi:MAG: hypothetical protein HFJ54_09175 [Clostridia bacterium]|nr:hypothetical protein [Clostridia bacterium]
MIKYTVARGKNIEIDEDPVGDEGPIVFDITNEGISTVVAWTIDDSGNATPKKTVNVKIDKNDPEKPEVFVLKDGSIDITNEREKWISSEGKIAVAGAEESPDIGLKIAKIEYEITKDGNTRTDSQNGQMIEIGANELGEDRRIYSKNMGSGPSW